MTNILLVDDDLNIQRLYLKFLAAEGFLVYQAMDAEMATEILISKKIDVVLLDINLPDIDGVFMREVIREFDENLRVIVSSVYPLTEQQKRIPVADDYFDKAHGTEWLLRTVKRVLRSKRTKLNQHQEATHHEPFQPNPRSFSGSTGCCHDVSRLDRLGDSRLIDRHQPDGL